MDPTVRLRIATRIHFALLRHYGEDVAVCTLLRSGEGAREALWVCQAADHAELRELGRQLAEIQRAEQAARAERTRRAAQTEKSPPQDAAWARDTSGFGVSRPAELPETDATRSAGSWFNPSRWLKRGAPRSPR